MAGRDGEETRILRAPPSRFLVQGAGSLAVTPPPCSERLRSPGVSRVQPAGIDGRWVLICFPSSAASPSPASLAACAPAFPLFPIWGLDGDESEGAPGLGTGGRTRVELPLHVESPRPSFWKLELAEERRPCGLQREPVPSVSRFDPVRPVSGQTPEL